jgi:hypothetical protein
MILQKLLTNPAVIFGLGLGAVATDLLSQHRAVTVPTVSYTGPHPDAKTHLTAINFTLSGIPFPAVLDSGNTTATIVSYSLVKAAHSERYPIIHTTNDDLHPRQELRSMPLGPLLHKLLSYWSDLVDQATFS